MEENMKRMSSLLGERISKARQKAKLTQEQLAEKLNVSRISIARYEAGEMMPKIQNIVTIALLLDVSVDYLLGLENRKGVKLKSFSFEAETALEDFVKEVIKQYEKERKI